MLPTSHGLFLGQQVSSAELSIDGVTGTGSTVLVSETTLNSTSSVTPSWTATDFTPDDFNWSFIDSGSDANLVSRSFDDSTLANPTISVTGEAASPYNTITHEIQLIATETSTGIQRIDTFTFQTTHAVWLGISTSSVTINRQRGTVGEYLVADASMNVSLQSDVASRLDTDYGVGNWHYKYEDDRAITTPPPRSRFAPSGSTDWGNAFHPYTTQSSSVEQLLEAEILSTDETYARNRKVTIVDDFGDPATINGYIISANGSPQYFPFGPTA